MKKLTLKNLRLDKACEDGVKKLIDTYARERSWAVLKYYPVKLTPERLEDCAKERSWAVLKYYPVKLIPERLEDCKKRCS